MSEWTKAVRDIEIWEKAEASTCVVVLAGGVE